MRRLPKALARKLAEDQPSIVDTVAREQTPEVWTAGPAKVRLLAPATKPNSHPTFRTFSSATPISP